MGWWETRKDFSRTQNNLLMPENKAKNKHPHVGVTDGSYKTLFPIFPTFTQPHPPARPCPALHAEFPTHSLLASGFTTAHNGKTHHAGARSPSPPPAAAPPTPHPSSDRSARGPRPPPTPPQRVPGSEPALPANSPPSPRTQPRFHRRRRPRSPAATGLTARH
jgi:hypothetical protein